MFWSQIKKVKSTIYTTKIYWLEGKGHSTAEIVVVYSSASLARWGWRKFWASKNVIFSSKVTVAHLRTVKCTSHIYTELWVSCPVLNPSHAMLIHERTSHMTVLTVSTNMFKHSTLHTGDIFIEAHDKTYTWTGTYVGSASVPINGIPRGFI